MSADITPELLAEIKRLDERATKGNFTVRACGENALKDDRLIIADLGADNRGIRTICEIARLFSYCISEEAVSNAELFALSRTALPALARRVEELEAMLDVAYDQRLASENIALLESDRIKKAEARATAAEQQRDEAVKALKQCEAALNDIAALHSSYEALTDSQFVSLASKIVERVLYSIQPKGNTP